MPRSKRCAATTKVGKRCKNLGKFDRFCHLHNTNTSKFNKFERGLNFAGGAVGVATGMYQVVEFVSHHWPSIVSIAGWTMSSEEDAGTAVIRSPKQNVRVKRGNKLSKSQVQNLLFDFDQWFEGLPQGVQRGTKERFGSREIVKLRGGRMKF